ncbi:MAG: High-affinity nickel-transporter [Bacillaceae bacterium]|nr:High-affinity nickel-transporter [Bacillaceae bacterium]
MMMEFLALAGFAILIGFRHGLDSDHIAAIADMVGAEKQKKGQLRMGIMYAIGHGVIVLVMGLLVIFLGSHLPESVLKSMEFLVGISLFVLGSIILYSVLKQNKHYTYESRIMIVYKACRRFFRRKTDEKPVNITKFGIFGSFVVGVIHGIGAETPSQVLVISSSAGLNNLTASLMQLLLFVVGLLLATILVTFIASWGFMKAKYKRKAYLFLGVITGVYSVFLGLSMMNGI